MSAYVIAACRTPIGKFLGGLSTLSAPRLAAPAIEDALDKCHVSPNRIDEVILGNVLSAGVGQAPARQAALLAGFPPSIAAVTINKVCGSGLKSVMLADQAIRAGDANLIVAGGMENMSLAPHMLLNSRQGHKFGDARLVDSMVFDGLTCSTEKTGMGELAEYIAEKYEVSRADQDTFAAESHRRATAAMHDGKLTSEITPVTVKNRKGDLVVTCDEGPRGDTSIDSLAKLPTAFRASGTVTAGNASQLSDGAAVVVVANEAAARELESPFKARIIASATSGVAPKDLFIAPVSAIEMVLNKANMMLEDVDLVELNEAFAAQCLACMRPLGLSHENVNVHGGAIALGHPLGASGARVLVTLLHALVERGLRRGIASLCLGGGNAVAMLVELDS